MFINFLRKYRQLKTDPILRAWFVGRLFRRWRGEPLFVAHHPPYLDGLLPLEIETPAANFETLAAGQPQAPLHLTLPGQIIDLQPGDETGLFARDFADIETFLALHRFAWIDAATPPEWVKSIWQAWAENHSIPDEGWPWHPYTAAERAINIMAFARQHGLPGSRDETLTILASHAPAIASRLEYFGEHHTSNHLANNGRGLYLLGLELGLVKAADMGGRILIEEAKRIFHPSGMLREGSSHYHLLLTRNLEQVAAAAELHDRQEALALSAISCRARAATEKLILPGGFPLIGDISPDLAPEKLLEQLAPFNAVSASLADAPSPLNGAGWYRHDVGPFSALWHAAPDGWSQIPGHGHQDLGSFELHCHGDAVFVDPGRGSYGETGEAARYRSAAVHNTLIVDGADPYPANKPYYDDTFRRQVGGPPPLVECGEHDLSITHHGFGRLTGVGPITRHWSFDGKAMVIIDTLKGSGKHNIKRILVTQLDLETDGGDILLRGAGTVYRLSADCKATIVAIPIWKAYGKDCPGNAIEFCGTHELPWTGRLRLERI